MKVLKLLLILLLFNFVIPKTSFPQEEVINDIHYIIGKGDTLEISVWGYPEVSRTVVVRPDGRVSLPLLEEEVKADGITPQQLDEEITLKLSKELKDPKVSVIVTAFGSKKIWVLGEVATPGVYSFTGELTTLEAIAQAGGYKNTACLENVMVIRNGNTSNPQAFMVNLAQVIGKKDTQFDMNLQAGDVVYLSRHAIAKIDSFIRFFTDKVGPHLYYGLDLGD